MEIVVGVENALLVLGKEPSEIYVTLYRYIYLHIYTFIYLGLKVNK